MYSKMQMLHNHRFYELLLVLAMACMLGISEAGPRIAKPGCKDHCGNVSIPYPFGIGPKCYHNPSFDVECNQGSDSFTLKGVLDNSVDGMQINFDKGERTLISPVPCYRICGGDGSPITLVFGTSNNLTGTPFLFSRKGNVLLVNSCGGAIILRDKNNKPIGGCGAICNKNGTTPGVDCYGVNCCQSTITTSVDFYSLEVDSIGRNRVIGDECTRAVLVDTNWIINKKKNLMHFQGLCDPAHVVLEWSVKDLPVNSPSYANATCVYKTPSVDDAGGFVCRCKKPFYQGNPYLPYGCQ